MGSKDPARHHVRSCLHYLAGEAYYNHEVWDPKRMELQARQKWSKEKHDSGGATVIPKNETKAKKGTPKSDAIDFAFFLKIITTGSSEDRAAAYATLYRAFDQQSEETEPLRHPLLLLRGDVWTGKGQPRAI